MILSGEKPTHQLLTVVGVYEGWYVPNAPIVDSRDDALPGSVVITQLPICNTKLVTEFLNPDSYDLRTSQYA